ncbi:DUF4255 domain-containing protein [Arthrobacter sp. JSM 101049]|uniref:DUF4255 domain-containing protein n=1 Tax=Arthrobacter sp. JSM 101049 TaxID=929097 RepID=UPI0035684A6F
MIRDVSDALRDLIERATPDLDGWVVHHSLSQAETAPVPENKAILALIDVAEHPHLRNRPLVEGATGLIRAPLSLQLHYLITYIGEHDEAQTRLARIVQAFHTTPILHPPALDPSLAGQVGRLAIRLMAPTADERNQVWSALGRPGRLALFYEVDVAPVPLLEREGSGRVREHRIDYVGGPR